MGGGVRLEVLPPPEDESHKKKFAGSLPQMKHGDFELTQSLAMESYITAIAPKFQGLTSQQRAIDDCYAATKEDIIQGTVPVLFASTEEKAKAKQELPALMDKFLSVLEEMRRSAASPTVSIFPRVPTCQYSSSLLQNFRSRSVTKRQATSGRASIPKSRRWWNERRAHPK